MSDKKDKDDIIVLNGRFLPPKIWEEQPGIDPQKQRAHILKHNHLTPVSFLNVIFGMLVKVPCVYVVLTLIRFFMSDFIAANFWPILAVVAVLIFLFVLYGQTIIKNAPDLQEELVFNGAVNLISFILGFVLTVYNG